LALPTQAHRGPTNEVDPCNILVGHERVHFTAYTPTFGNNKDYCQIIPNLGKTNLVFDYQGKSLRDMTVEFEVTKEPEATRIFYQAPQKIKSGTFNGLVDFSQFGAGNYLVHVAIVHNGKSIDNHIPISVGQEKEPGNNLPMTSLLMIAILGVLFYIIKHVASKDTARASDA
jgi:hypothetical protein